LRHAALLALMLLTAATARSLTPTEFSARLHPVALEQLVPVEFGPWSEDRLAQPAVAPSEQDASIARVYSQVLSRTYRNARGVRIMLSIAYSDDQRDRTGKQVHKPEVCYPAQGFAIVAHSRASLELPYGALPLRRLVAVQGERIEPVSYWITLGGKPQYSGMALKLAQVRTGLAGRIEDGLIFRVSSVDADSTEAYQQQATFITDLFNTASPLARRTFFGVGA
jgi:EpsI family protein